MLSLGNFNSFLNAKASTKIADNALLWQDSINIFRL